MNENQAAQAAGSGSESGYQRPSDLMTRYDTPSESQQPAATEPQDGAASTAVQGTDQGTSGEAGAAGVDAASPEYRHWQSVSDRAIAKARNEMKAEVDALKAQLTSIQGKVVQAEIKGRPDAEQTLAENMILDFSRAKPYAASQEDDLSPYSDSITSRIRHEISEAVRLIQERGLQEQAQYAAQAREQKLVEFAQTLPPDKQLEYVQLVNQMGTIAKSDPDAFLELAKYKFQPQASAPVQQAPAHDPTRLAQSVTNASTRPTVNGRASPIAAGGNMRDKILAAVRQHGVGA